MCLVACKWQPCNSSTYCDEPPDVEEYQQWLSSFVMVLLLEI